MSEPAAVWIFATDHMNVIVKQSTSTSEQVTGSFGLMFNDKHVKQIKLLNMSDYYCIKFILDCVGITIINNISMMNN